MMSSRSLAVSLYTKPDASLPQLWLDVYHPIRDSPFLHYAHVLIKVVQVITAIVLSFLLTNQRMAQSGRPRINLIEQSK